MSSTLSKRKTKHQNNAEEHEKKSDAKARPKDLLSSPLWVRVSKKILLSLMVMLVMYFYTSYQNNKPNMYRTMASVTDNILDTPLAQQIACSNQYGRERKLYPKCTPIKCGRFVSDSIVSEEEAMELRLLAETVFAISKPSGGVAIFDLNSGALSNGTQFINLLQLIKYKNSNLIKQKTMDTFRTVKNKILHNIAIHFGASPDKLRLTSPVFFTKITNVVARTLNDEYWHPHVDKVTYGSYTYTALLYLSNYDQDFTGGRFIFIDTPHNITVEPKFGRVSAFTSSSENTHMVERVQSGARFALTIAFTCEPKNAIKDPSVNDH